MTVLEYRRSIIPAPGKVFIQADMPQIELRILAELSEDPVLLEAFDTGQDPHLVAASLVYNKAQIDITKLERYACKKVGFGIIYGQTAHGLAPALSISERQAQTLIDKYMRNFYHVQKWIEETKARIRRDKKAVTRGGRVRYFDNANSELEYIVRGCERAGVNHEIQGFAGDCMKESIILLAEGLHSCQSVALVGVFHDEGILECPQDQTLIVEAQTALKNAFEAGHRKYLKRVPVTVEPKVLKHWGEAK